MSLGNLTTGAFNNVFRSGNHHDFLNPQLFPENVDRWLVRRSILDALINCRSSFHGFFLDVGCGVMPYRSLLLESPSKIQKYIGLDIPGVTYSPPDLYWDGMKIPIPDSTIDSGMATEVLEHCPYPASVLNEVHRVLKSDGAFFFSVPFLWPLHDVPHDEYRYTPFSLKRLFTDAGFASVELYALGGWNASLAQLLGLWVRRGPISSKKRRILSTLAVPIVRYLTSKDIKPSVFSESTMITGLAGIARK